MLFFFFFLKKKSKINTRGWRNLQIVPYDIKNNSQVPVVGKNNNLLSEVNFRPLT
jgi:hypothetical protein